MIKCNTKLENNKIIYLEVKGHANYSKNGMDIVCAGASMLCYTIANALESYKNSATYLIKENSFEFTFIENSVESNLLLKTLYEGMLMLKEQYPNYIQIKEV
jgi:uncharacterized protein YsxB (DUF464 family)